MQVRIEVIIRRVVLSIEGASRDIMRTIRAFPAMGYCGCSVKA